MKVSAETKARTREEIVQVARGFFAREGFEATTTRAIATAAGIAAGTLFNYFPTKESLALALISEALQEARDEFYRTIRGEERLDELLFSLAAISLRHLRPLRGVLLPVFETTLSPLKTEEDSAQAVRAMHLAVVRRVIADSAGQPEVSLVSLHLYWTLFLGVVAFWTQDDSPNQEMTLALLDQSMRMYAGTFQQSSIPTITGVTP